MLNYKHMILSKLIAVLLRTVPQPLLYHPIAILFYRKVFSFFLSYPVSISPILRWKRRYECPVNSRAANGINFLSGHVIFEIHVLH